MSSTNTLADRIGLVAAQEFETAGAEHKPRLTAWLDTLPTLDDDALFWETASAIHGSALAQSFRGNWDHAHCMASAAWYVARQRHRAAGHTDVCRGDTIYARAYAQVLGEQGHIPRAPQPCTCGVTP